MLLIIVIRDRRCTVLNESKTYQKIGGKEYLMRKFNIPRISGDQIELSINNGDQLFIVGPNGSGKSALIQHFILHAKTFKIIVKPVIIYTFL